MNVNDSDLPDSVPPAEGAPAADAEAKPKRRRAPRKTAATASADDGGAGAPAAEPVPAAAPAPEPAVARVAVVAEGAAAGDASVGEGGDGGESREGGESGDSAEGDGKRRRNRNRRRGRRGDRERAPGEGAEGAEGADRGASAADSADDADADADDGPAAEPVPTAPPSPKDANELFSEVLSGQYDAEPMVEAPAEEDTKRVLAPDPDAPKLHKVLAQSGIGSRRDMEELIAEGRITVNGEPAHTGQRISFGDQIRIDNKPVKVRIQPPLPRVIAYHKPVGEVVTRDDPEGRPTVFRRLPRLQHGKWQSVGRLDINTEGLLLFTNSGDLANQLMHPRFGVEREYAVRVLGTLVEEQREELLEGVEIEGQRCAFRSIDDGGGEGVNRWYRVVIAEGRNREVRKLFDAVGLAVSRLIRIRYGSIVLPRGLKRGIWVDLASDDVRALRQLAGLGRNGQREDRGGERGDRGDRGDRQGDRRGPKGGGQQAQPGPQPRRDGGGGKPRDRNNNGGDRADRGDRSERRERREPGEGGPIPNPLQQTYDKRAIREARAPKREYSEDGPIPNPLEQTYDKRFVQKPRGFGGGGGGGGRKGGGGERQPDPMQTSLGYIGADAFHKKMIGGGGGGGGGRRGGGGGGGGGGRGRR